MLMTEVSGEKLWKYKGYYQVTGKWYKVSGTASGSSDLSLSLWLLQIYLIIFCLLFMLYLVTMLHSQSMTQVQLL